MSVPYPPGKQPGGDFPRCTQHPWSRAVARCVNCGRLVCPLCRVVAANRNYCIWCAGHRTAPAYPVAKRHEPVFPNTPWGVGEAIIIFLISYLSASVFTFFAYEILGAVASAEISLFLLIFMGSAVLYSLLLGTTYYSVRVRHHSSIAALGLTAKGLGKGFATGLLAGLPLFIGAILLAYLTQLFLRPTGTDYITRSVTEIGEGGVGAGLVALLCFTLVVLAPVCEEIFFRGYLYPTLRNRMDMQPAMILNGLLFAVAHFDLVGFLPRFLLAYGLCYIYERNRTLAGPIAGHALYNGLILLLSGIWGLF
jgi:uncharacterized protein